MNKDTLDKLKALDVDVAHIADAKAREDVALLLAGLEAFAAENATLKEELQKLKDELNRLKGEQGQPKIRPQSQDPKDPAPNDDQAADNNHSSEKERNPKSPPKKEKRSKRKKHKIKIHKREVCQLDPCERPKDAVFKGYEYVTVQGIVIKAHNIEFKREVWYSPSERRRFLAPLPAGFQGQFSPELKALVVALHHGSRVSEPNIHRFLKDVDVDISIATISRILTDPNTVLHPEKAEIVAAGLGSTDYQQMDDTGARVKGKNYVTHVLCNPFYTAYFTRPHKDRLTVLEILKGSPLMFALNQEAFDLMKALELPEKYWDQLAALVEQHASTALDRTQMDEILAVLFPNQNKHHKNRKLILEAAALTDYRQREDALKILMCDDAPQFKKLAELLALCWVHEGRHYKKLKPFRKANKHKRDQFLTEFWAFYHKLLAYKQAPEAEAAQALERAFDALFGQTTGYAELDDRIAKTRAKKEHLLLVLQYPHLPLHNNTSELSARRQAQYRDVSLQTQTEAGTEFKDSAMTVEQTAKKMKVSFFHYLKDRFQKIFEMPSLASLITDAAQVETCDTG